MSLNWGRYYWPVWLIVVAVTLLIPEISALATNAGNTLSEWVWRQLDVTKGQQLPWTAAHYLVFGVWLTLVSWLTWHFFFRRFV